MELTLRNQYIENWAIFLVFCQVILVGTTYYRTYGGLLEAILDTGRNTTLGSRIQLGAGPKSLLHFNNLIGVVLFVAAYLAGSFYLNAAFFYAAVFSCLIFFFWHLDYFLFWVITGKRKMTFQYIGIGNVPWFLFGLVLTFINVFMVFNKPSDWGVIVFFVVLLLTVVTRVVLAGIFAHSAGFAWYYIILYLCSVYLLPIALIKKLFGALLLELLTH